MHRPSIFFLAIVGFVATTGCSQRSPLKVGDGAVGGTADAGSGGYVGSGGHVGSGGFVGSGGGGAGGTTDCLRQSPLGAGYGGGACEGVRCINAEPPALGYATCSWLVTAGRASVFEAVRKCFTDDPAFCALHPASVDACTNSVYPRACPGPGATVDGVKVDCNTVAAACPGLSQQQCALMTDILNDKYYQAAFECYVRQNPRPTDCAAALRKCTNAPQSGAGGTPGSGGTTGAGGSTSTSDGGQPACPDLSGSWRVAATCQGPGAFFNGTFSTTILQIGCFVSLSQFDEPMTTSWSASGTLEPSGKVSLRGDFGFTDSNMCDLETTRDGWQGRCASATQACTLQGTKAPS